MTRPNAAVPLDDRAARLTRLYVVALAAVALLSITGQLLVQQALHRQLSDSTVVNLAGRQRMLSQKLTKAALVYCAREPSDRKVAAVEIEDTLALWKRTHLGLQRGDAELRLPGGLSQGVAKRFQAIEPTFLAMATAAEQLAQGANPEQQQPLIDKLLELEPKFLAAMDSVVFELDAEAQARVAHLQCIEWVLLSLTLLVLAGEGLLVFRPAVRRIREAAQELLRSREELRIAKEAAESASEQKSRFLATISHELRNPLHAILGNTELALQSPVSEEQQERLATIDDSAQALLALVNDLLDLACLQAGQLRVHVEPVDLRTVVTRVLLMVRPLAERKVLQLTDELPTGDLLAAADPLRLQQVLLNLLGNAVKFTEYGEVGVRIVRAQSVGSWRIEVHDTGPGIPADLQQAIFAAFVQLDSSSKREQAGVGLGLAISAGLLSLMRGRCGVESALGAGSCFWIELPVAVQATPQPVEQEELPTDNRRAKLRVLVADDDEVNRRLICDYLKALGHEPHAATQGRQALALFHESSWDAVLLDWHMPQLDGWEVAREIRTWEQKHDRPPMPLIAVTAAGEVADDAAGIDRVLTKPVALRTLKQALAAVCQPKSLVQHVGLTPGRSPEERWSKSIARLQGNEQLFNSIAEIFLEQLPATLEQLIASADDQDFAQLARQAHLLRGQASNFDAERLIAATESLENAAAAADKSKCEAAIQQVVSAASELALELQSTLEHTAA